MNHKLEYFALLLLIFKCSSTKEPEIKRCVSGYELSFFHKKHENWASAIQACKDDENSRLVKVDNANITTVIDSIIKIEEIFYIDAHADNDRQFTWSDGSKVNLRNENGYQNWYTNQPNDAGGGEDCIIVGRGGKQWKDSSCTEKLNYILCQKDKDPCITVNSKTPYVHTCIATGLMEPYVEWRSDGNVVSNTSDQTIYQTKHQGISTLYYENATIGDVGEYLCDAWIGNGKEEVSAPKQIKVNGTPSIIHIESFKCNSSLLITWKPSISALGFPHRIIVLLNKNEIVANLSISPDVETEYFTEITELQSTTEYNVEIKACSKDDKCTDDYGVNRDDTTNGIFKSVINASIEQLGGNNTCIVSWEWPYITQKDNATQFKIIIRSGSTTKSSNEDIRFVNITTSHFSYYFDSQISATYNVEIQSVESVGSCKTVHAIGSCIGKDADIQSSSTTNMLPIILPVAGGVLLLLIVVIVVVLLVRKRRNKAFNEPAIIMDNTVNENPSNPTVSTDNYDINDYAAIERVETSSSTRIERTNELYAMASEVESTTNAPIYAAVNKERIHKPTSIPNQHTPEDNTYDTLHSQQQNIGSSDTYASVSKPTDSAQPVYAQVNKK